MNNARKLQQEVTKLKEQNTDLRNEISTLNDQSSKIKQLNTLLASRKSRINSLAHRVINLDIEVKELANYLEVERADKDKLDVDFQKLQVKFNDLKLASLHESEKYMSIIQQENERFIECERRSKDASERIYKELSIKVDLIEELQNIKSRWWYKLFNRN